MNIMMQHLQQALRWILVLGCGLLSAGVYAGSLPWQNLRDVTLFILPQQPTQLSLSWSDAWQAEAHTDRYFLQDAKGNLLAQQYLDSTSITGSASYALKADGPYQLTIPGYSFRNFRMDVANSLVLLQPPKGRLALTSRQPNSTLYFRTRTGVKNVLGGRYQDGGIVALEAKRLSDGQRVRLTLNQQYDKGFYFDQVTLPDSGQEDTWQLTLIGQGKAAFWLDGSSNLFAASEEELTALRLLPGQVRLTLGSKLLGPTPKLGMAQFDPNQLPASIQAGLQSTQPRFSANYAFYDVLNRNPTHFEAAIQGMQKMGVKDSLTLLGGTGAQGAMFRVLTASQEVKTGLAAWIKLRIRQQNGGLHYISFADEPNLNYPDYATYQRYFREMAQWVRNYPGAYKAGIRIAVPASSLFIDGPSSSNSSARKGADWTRRLLQDNPGLIDAIAWHEWDHSKNLLSTRWYRYSLQQTVKLVGTDDQGRPKLPLFIDQTNIGSGNSTSPYDQNTFYAGLWWMSVVINSSQDGWLSGLAWFLSIDDENHQKGVVRYDSGKLSMRPVAGTMAFIARHWGNTVQALDNTAFDVDAMAMTSADNQQIILGVNKAARQQQVSLSGLKSCSPDAIQLTLLTASGEQPHALTCQANTAQFTLPPQSIFAMSWKAGP